MRGGWAVLVAVGLAAAGCAGGDAAPSGPWCARAVAMLDAGREVAEVDPADREALEQAYGAALDTARDAVPGAPADLAADLVTVRDGTAALVDALDRHGFDLAAAAADPTVVAVADDPAHAAAAARADGAIRARCQSGPPAT